MSISNYILHDHDAVLCNNLTEWAHWFETADRHVAETYIGESYVSTVFLGLDHSFGDGPPLLFETLVFDGPLDGEMTRCTTWVEAEVMHKVMCERVLAQLQ